MRHRLSALLAASLVATILPAAATATGDPAGDHPYEAALDVDFEASKVAMTAARERVEALLEYPGDAGTYFTDRPLHWVHPAESVEQTQPDGTAFRARVLEI
ncbi:MAG TPA: hypothetical protein VGA69_00960, partial [Nitriliruptorales bacterium]